MPHTKQIQIQPTQTHREAALAAVEAVLVHGHAHTHAALLVGARLAQALHLAVVINAVELEHRQLDGLVHVLHLLGLGVGLLLALLTTTAEAKHLIVECVFCSETKKEASKYELEQESSIRVRFRAPNTFCNKTAEVHIYKKLKVKCAPQPVPTASRQQVRFGKKPNIVCISKQKETKH